MKRFAKIKNDRVVNIEVHQDGAEVPSGYVDVTVVRGGIGDPVVEGVIIPKPSRYHTLSGLEWVITPEDQVLKDTEGAEALRAGDIRAEQKSAGLAGITVQQAKDIISGRYDTVRGLPEDTVDDIQAKIGALIDVCEWVDKKEAVYLLR